MFPCTAIIVTRGDVPLWPIVETFAGYQSFMIWDNSHKALDMKAYGRYLQGNLATTQWVYFQDDDLIFREHAKLLAAREEGKIVANMPSPWYETNQYDRLGQCMVGGGAIAEWGVWLDAIERYLDRWPADDLFLTYVDEVVGMLTPHTRVDLGYEVLPVASDPGRTWTTPGAAERKEVMRGRALELRTQPAAN